MKKYLKRHDLPNLPDPAVGMINSGMFSLFQIKPVQLSNNNIAEYILRLDKTDFRYLNAKGSPLPERPQNVNELEIIEGIRFEDIDNTSDSLIANFLCNTK